jgi:glucose-6-phosphate dehydrogenase assembly protein OpcA
MEAVRLLAGFAERVDEDVRRRIQRTAQSLLKILPDEAALCGLEDASQTPELTELSDIDARRRKAKGRRKIGG